jgi:hypothetical protein
MAHGVTAADDEAGGRFAKQEGARAQVIGADGPPSYPAAAPWVQTELPPEPPLSAYDNPALEPSNVSPSAQATGPTSADAPSVAPPLGDVQRADVGPLSSLPSKQTNTDGGSDADTR